MYQFIQIKDFYDFVWDEIIKPHKENWQPEDEVFCMLDGLQQDLHDSKITETDILHAVLQTLMAGAGEFQYFG